MFSGTPSQNNTDQEASQIYEMAYQDGNIVFLVGNTAQNETQQIFEFTYQNLNRISIETNQKALQELETIYQNADMVSLMSNIDQEVLQKLNAIYQNADMAPLFNDIDKAIPQKLNVIYQNADMARLFIEKKVFYSEKEKTINQCKTIPSAIRLKDLFLLDINDKIRDKTPEDKFMFLKNLLDIYFIRTEKIKKTSLAENEKQETIAVEYFLKETEGIAESIENIKEHYPGVNIFLAFFLTIKNLILNLWELKNQLEKEKIIAPDEYKLDEHKLVKTLFSLEMNSTPTDATSEEQTHQTTNTAQGLFLT